MIGAWLILDAEGVNVTGILRGGPPADLPHVAVPENADPADFLGHYLDGDQLRPRPASPAPIRQGDGSHAIAACPPATRVTVFDLIGGEVMAMLAAETAGETITFVLPDAGTYLVEVSAPPPHVPTSTKIEVA